MNRVFGTANEAKKIAIYKINEDDIVEFYEGNVGYGTMTRDQMSEIKKKPLSSTHLLVKADTRDKKMRDKSLKKQYLKYVEIADKLLALTDGKINMYKTGTIAKTALQLFYDFGAPTAEPIQYFEATILELCKSGGLIYGKIYDGKAYKYDISSQYPSIMRDDHMQFPYKKGKMRTLTQEEFEKMKFFTYGCYNVKITSKVDPRLFILNTENWYTHIDLNYAKNELGYTLEYIDGFFLDYTNCLINGAKLFRSFVDYMYKFKQQGHKEIKPILNALWGVLCQRNTITFILKENDELFDIDSLETITPCGKNGFSKIKSFKVDKIVTKQIYDNDYARIKPFLTAKCRTKMSEIVKKNLDNVVRVYIDGLLLTKRIEGTTVGNDIGQMKFEEKYKRVQVLNARDVITKFE